MARRICRWMKSMLKLQRPGLAVRQEMLKMERSHNTMLCLIEVQWFPLCLTFPLFHVWANKKDATASIGFRGKLFVTFGSCVFYQKYVILKKTYFLQLTGKVDCKPPGSREFRNQMQGNCISMPTVWAVSQIMRCCPFCYPKEDSRNRNRRKIYERMEQF